MCPRYYSSENSINQNRQGNQGGFDRFNNGSMRRASYGGGRGAPRGSSNLNRGDGYSSRGSGYGSRGGRDNDGYRRGGGGGGSNYNSLKNKEQPGGSLRKPKWENETLQPFQKNFYTPHPIVLNRYALFYIYHNIVR